MKSNNPHRCKHCDRSFKKAIGLADHMRNAHGITRPVPTPVGRRPALTEIDPICIECGNLAVLVSGEEVYPHRPDLYAKRFYRCVCGAYCGCHPNSVVPLGYPCGRETRQARMNAHAVFDEIWKRKEMSRPSAYKWLSEATGIDPEKCHIAMMTREQALLVCRVVAARRKQEKAA